MPSRSRSRTPLRYRSPSPSPPLRSRRKNSRSPMSNRKRHSGDRTAPDPNRCLGVFGLSLYTTDKEIEKEFSRFGPLESVSVVLDAKSGRSRGFAFVKFENLEDATQAKNAMADLELDGKKIRVDYSVTKRPHTPTPGIYMGSRIAQRDSARYRRTPSPIYRGRRSPSPMYRGRQSHSPYYSRSRRRSPSPHLSRSPPSYPYIRGGGGGCAYRRRSPSPYSLARCRGGDRGPSPIYSHSDLIPSPYHGRHGPPQRSPPSSSVHCRDDRYRHLPPPTSSRRFY